MSHLIPILLTTSSLVVQDHAAGVCLLVRITECYPLCVDYAWLDTPCNYNKQGLVLVQNSFAIDQCLI